MMVTPSETSPALIPTLSCAWFIRGGDLLKVSGKAIHLPTGEVEAFRDVFYGGITLDELASRSGKKPEAMRRVMEFTSAVRFVPFELHQEWDVVMVDQGATGVFIQALELWKNLNRRMKVLFFTMVSPPFPDQELVEDSRLRARLITLDDLVDRGLPRSYLSYYHFLRTVLQRIKTRLLLFTHRCEATYFFDIVGRRPTVVYSDFYHEEKFAFARHLYGNHLPSESERRELLEHLYHNIHSQFQLSNPDNDLVRLRADWLVLCGAKENWCWSATETETLRKTSLLENISFEGPSIDIRRLDAESRETERKRQILFITTMTNYHRKGLVALSQAIPHLPEDLRVAVVTRVDVREMYSHPDPRIDFYHRVEKSEVIRLYHESLFYVRVAEEDTLPYSLTEAMACRLPVIVSPEIQVNFPAIEDGVTGFVVPFNDVNLLVKRMNYLLDHPEARQRMGEACRERVLRFDMTQRMKRIEQVMVAGNR